LRDGRRWTRRLRTVLSSALLAAPVATAATLVMTVAAPPVALDSAVQPGRIQPAQARVAHWTPPRPAMDSHMVPAQVRVAASAPPQPAKGAFFGGTPAVGALFTMTSGGRLVDHFCSGSVVDSPARDLVLTAAHCVGNPETIAFVPGYHDGDAPLGIWPVRRVILSGAWKLSHDPDDDFAFLVVNRPGSRTRVQDVTGGEQLAVDSPPGEVVRVIGYPDGEASPIACENQAHAFGPTQLVFDCGGYSDGTSGGPWLTDVSPSTGLGKVVGVTGGFQQGGNSPSVSYAARFSESLAALYRIAVAAFPAR
jgi:hypothetical protein